MKRKNLLNESQVRKFMKLANIDKSLTSNFLTEAKHADEVEEGRHAKGDQELEERGGMMPPAKRDDEMREGRGMDDDEMREGRGMDEDDMGDMGDMDDMGDMGDEPGIDLSETDALALVDAIVDAIGAETGIEFNTSMAGGGDDLPMDTDMDADMDADMDMGADDDSADLDDDMEVMDEDEVIEETLRRVTYRLNAINDRQKVINEAMRRIQVRYGRRD